MTTSRNAGKTASADFAADLAAAGYPVFANDDQYGQVELTTCADASGTWHIAAASDFVSTCGSTRPSPGPTPSPTPTPGTKQCVRNQHGPPCTGDSECGFPGCVRCAHSGFCTDVPLTPRLPTEAH
uniref:Uncharacterized protein n=1 Tax=Haptolina ericina TaxID=156174 RepID=A0A7S3F188_9EUKA